MRRFIDLITLQGASARHAPLLVAGPALVLLAIGGLYLLTAATLCDPLYGPPVSQVDGAEGARTALERTRAGQELPPADITPWPSLSFGPYCQSGDVR